MNKFVEFLTSKIGDSAITMWMLLTAIIVVIIVLGVIIGVVLAKKDSNKKKALKSKENAAVESDEPAITAPPSMQTTGTANADEEVSSESAEVKESVTVETVSEKETVKPSETVLNTAAETDAETKESASEKANPPIIDTAVKPTESAVNKEANKPKDEIKPTDAETAEKKTVIEAVEITEPKAIEPKAAAKPNDNTAETKSTVPLIAKETKPQAAKVIQVKETPKDSTDSVKATPAAPVKETQTVSASAAKEAAADKTTNEKPTAKKIVAKKIAPTAAQKTDSTASEEPKKAKVIGADALPKKIKNNLKLEEVKTTIENTGESFGKYVIFKDERANPNKPFKFALRANNGQLLFESEPYKVKPREASIQAFKKHVQIGEFVVDEDKFGFFRFKLYTDTGKLLGVGESYKTRSACESSIDSVKRFSISATQIDDTTLSTDEE